MSAELTSHPRTQAREAEPAVVNGELHCALTGKPVRPEDAYWAPPLITTGDLLRTIFRTLFTAPGTLGQVLLNEQPNVPYAAEARQELAARRTTEQLKLIGLLIALAALLIVPIIMIVS